MESFVNRARAFAAKAHAGHVRKYTGEPYFNHLEAVAELVRSVNGDEAMVAAAYLHDTLEDTATTQADLIKAFGTEVAGLVVELTDVSTAKDGNRAQRKAIERARLAKVSARAQTIKLADLIDNTKSIGERDPAFAAVYLVEKAALLTVLTLGDRRLMKLAKSRL